MPLKPVIDGLVAVPPPGTGTLPSQTGQNGKYLTTNGTTASWVALSSGSGDVTASGTLTNDSVALGAGGTSVKVTTTGTGVVTALGQNVLGSGGIVLDTSPTITTPTISGAVVFPDDVRQTFNPGTNNAGLNVGSLAGDPSSPSNGDLWYDSAANELTARINGANVALGAGGGGIGGTVGSTANVIPRADGTGGSTLKASLLSIGDTGILTNTSGEFRIEGVTVLKLVGVGSHAMLEAAGGSAQLFVGLNGNYVVSANPIVPQTDNASSRTIGDATYRWYKGFFGENGLIIGNATNGATITTSGSSPDENLVLDVPGTGNLILAAGLPSSDPGVPGALYRSAGAVMISL
jgi:hypothetical protein